MEGCGLDSPGSGLGQWRALVTTAINFRVPQKTGNFDHILFKKVYGRLITVLIHAKTLV
jgi:hypothetical protein